MIREGVVKKLESEKYEVRYATALTELDGGQKLVRFYDPSGNLIEIRTPWDKFGNRTIQQRSLFQGCIMIREGVVKKLESEKYEVRYATALTELDGGQKLVRFYDPSGNLIEIRTPWDKFGNRE